jgi:hypothetical protein
MIGLEFCAMQLRVFTNSSKKIAMFIALDSF